MAGLEQSFSAYAEGSVDSAGAAQIAIIGELDIASVNAVEQDLQRILIGRPDRVVFDLGKLAFMDSSGIALMVQLANSVGSMEVRKATSIVRRVIEIVGLSEVLGLMP